MLQLLWFSRNPLEKETKEKEINFQNADTGN